MKRHLFIPASALALILSLAVGLLPNTALAADGDFVIENSVLTEYRGAGGDVVIPDGVTEIGDKAFYNCGTLTGVQIPEGVERIGDKAFYNCRELNYVTFPSTLTEIGELTFQRCVKLTQVDLPSGVREMSYQAFMECDGLTSFALPEGLTKYNKRILSKCANLKAVYVPKTVRGMAGYVFAGSTQITDIFYGGSKAQWDAISKAPDCPIFTPGHTPTFHYNASPEDLAVFAGPPAQPTAYASSQTVLVDGQPVVFQAYALRDASGDTNYIKLRDVACVLNGTDAQFEVGWDGAVNIQPGTPYSVTGTEMSTPFSGNRPYTLASAQTKINGVPTPLSAIVLQDDDGGSYTYYKLRDLGSALGFTVGWSQETGISITTK